MIVFWFSFGLAVIGLLYYVFYSLGFNSDFLSTSRCNLLMSSGTLNLNSVNKFHAMMFLYRTTVQECK